MVARISAAGALLAALLLAGCASNLSTGPSGTRSSSAPTLARSQFASIAELHDALVNNGIDCKLSYAGLRDDVSNREVSICTIDGEQAFLYIWFAPDKLRQMLNAPEGHTGIVAAGENWSITVSSHSLAEKLARVLGGQTPT